MFEISRTGGKSMNERIEKLGEQADLLGECTPTKIPGRYVGYITEEQILKFAELIVRECAEQIKTHGISASREDYGDYEIGFNAGLFHALYTIKQHFGVEE